MECSQEEKDCLDKASRILRLVPVKRPRQCEHIKTNGEFCGSPALRGRNYCYFHLTHIGRRLRAERNHAQASPESAVVPLELPPFEDANSIQIALMQVVNAILQNRIDTKRAGLVLYALQTASSNLNHGADFAQSPEATVAGRYDDFEDDFELGDDVPELSTDEAEQAEVDEEYTANQQREQVLEACARLDAAMQESRIADRIEETEEGEHSFRCDPVDGFFCSVFGPRGKSGAPAVKRPEFDELDAASQRLELLPKLAGGADFSPDDEENEASAGEEEELSA